MCEYHVCLFQNFLWQKKVARRGSRKLPGLYSSIHSGQAGWRRHSMRNSHYFRYRTQARVPVPTGRCRDLELRSVRFVDVDFALAFFVSFRRGAGTSLRPFGAHAYRTSSFVHPVARVHKAPPAISVFQPTHAGTYAR